jgi:hypothetical protein
MALTNCLCGRDRFPCLTARLIRLDPGAGEFGRIPQGVRPGPDVKALSATRFQGRSDPTLSCDAIESWPGHDG